MLAEKCPVFDSFAVYISGKIVARIPICSYQNIGMIFKVTKNGEISIVGVTVTEDKSLFNGWRA
jgi:hypothetical protein